MAPLPVQVLQGLRRISEGGCTRKNMTEAEIKAFETKPIEFNKQAQEKEEASLKTVKEKFEETTNNLKTQQRLIPSASLLDAHNKALSLDTTIADIEGKIKHGFQQITDKRYENLDKKFMAIEILVEDYINKKVTSKDASEKLISQVGPILLVTDTDEIKSKKAKNMFCHRLKKVLEKNIKYSKTSQKKENKDDEQENKEDDEKDEKTRLIMNECKNIVAEGVEHYFLKDKIDTKKQWGLVNNRRGKMGENKVAQKLYDLLVKHKIPGIVATGIKAHCYLSEYLEEFGIKFSIAKDEKTEVEHDIMMLTEEDNSVNISFIQVKVPEQKPWKKPEEDQRHKILSKHVTDAARQLKKDIETCLDIFPDFHSQDFSNNIKIKYYVAVPEESIDDWQYSDEVTNLILFEEDFISLETLGKKVLLDAPKATSLPTRRHDLRDIFMKIGSRYFGMTSFVPLKTPREGYEAQKAQLDEIYKHGERRFSVKTIRLGEEQSDIYNSKIGLTSGYVAVAPYGGGKTTLVQLEGRRIAQQAYETKNPTALYFCVWQPGATNLVTDYNDYIKTLPECGNLDVKVTTKLEICEEMGVKSDGGKTTDEINQLCSTISAFDKRDFYLLVDEVWVLYQSPRHYRGSKEGNADPNEVIGNIPFMKDDQLYPWSKLDPGDVHLIVSVMPDSEHLVDKQLITDLPPEQGKVVTHILPRSFRCTCKIHHFLMYLEAQIESFVRDTGGWRYILPPETEEDGHNIEGVEPEWISINKAPHVYCIERSCDICLIKIIEPALKKNLEEVIQEHQIPIKDVAIIILGFNNTADKIDDTIEPAREYLQSRIKDHLLALKMEDKSESLEVPEITVKVEDEFEGLEVSVAFTVTNGSPAEFPHMIPYSVSRANTRLYMYSEDCKDILMVACEKGFMKKNDELTECFTEEYDRRMIIMAEAQKNKAEVAEVADSAIELRESIDISEIGPENYERILPIAEPVSEFTLTKFNKEKKGKGQMRKQKSQIEIHQRMMNQGSFEEETLSQLRDEIENENRGSISSISSLDMPETISVSKGQPQVFLNNHCKIELGEYNLNHLVKFKAEFSAKDKLGKILEIMKEKKLIPCSPVVHLYDFVDSQEKVIRGGLCATLSLRHYICIPEETDLLAQKTKGELKSDRHSFVCFVENKFNVFEFNLQSFRTENTNSASMDITESGHWCFVAHDPCHHQVLLKIYFSHPIGGSGPYEKAQINFVASGTKKTWREANEKMWDDPECIENDFKDMCERKKLELAAEKISIRLPSCHNEYEVSIGMRPSMDLPLHWVECGVISIQDFILCNLIGISMPMYLEKKFPRPECEAASHNMILPYIRLLPRNCKTNSWNPLMRFRKVRTGSPHHLFTENGCSIFIREQNQCLFKKKPTGVAFVVGNSYQNSKENTLLCCQNNATKFKAYLEDESSKLNYQWFVEAENNVTEKELKTLLNRYGSETTLARNSEAICFYFSGHGHYFEKENHLITEDDRQVSVDAIQKKIMDTFKSWDPAKNFIFIFDCCRNCGNPKAALRRTLYNTPYMMESTNNNMSDNVFALWSTQRNDVENRKEGVESTFNKLLLLELKQGTKWNELSSRINENCNNEGLYCSPFSCGTGFERF